MIVFVELEDMITKMDIDIMDQTWSSKNHSTHLKKKITKNFIHIKKCRISIFLLYFLLFISN